MLTGFTEREKRGRQRERWVLHASRALPPVEEALEVPQGHWALSFAGGFALGAGRNRVWFGNGCGEIVSDFQGSGWRSAVLALPWLLAVARRPAASPCLAFPLFLRADCVLRAMNLEGQQVGSSEASFCIKKKKKKAGKARPWQQVQPVAQSPNVPTLTAASPSRGSLRGAPREEAGAGSGEPAELVGPWAGEGERRPRPGLETRREPEGGSRSAVGSRPQRPALCARLALPGKIAAK